MEGGGGWCLGGSLQYPEREEGGGGGGGEGGEGEGGAKACGWSKTQT